MGLGSSLRRVVIGNVPGVARLLLSTADARMFSATPRHIRGWWPRARARFLTLCTSSRPRRSPSRHRTVHPGGEIGGERTLPGGERIEKAG